MVIKSPVFVSAFSFSIRYFLRKAVNTFFRKGGCALNGAKRGMGTNSNNIGSRIKARRKALGLTQEGLAGKMNVVKSTISAYENGNSRIDSVVIEELAETLNTTVAYLFGETENSEPAGTGNSLEELIMGEVNEYLDQLRNRSEMRMLFSVTKGATKEEIEQAVKIIEALRKND